MKKLLAALFILLGLVPASAQTRFTMPPPAGVFLGGFQVVTACGSGSLTAGWTVFGTMDATGNICTNATGGGGTSYTVNYGAAIGTKGTPGGFKDGSGNFQSFTGSVTNGLSIDCGASNNILCGLIASPIPSQAVGVPVGGFGLCDGANGATNPCTTVATVKAASTPAAATDKALVVDQRPGTTVTTTTAASDPCQNNVATIKPFSITTATTTNIVTGTAAKKLYVCYLYMQTAAANNVAVISGTTGATCGANTAALVGGTTAANGLNNAANGGQAMGNGGFSVLQVQTNNDDICIITSASTPLAGVIKYVVQ